MENSNDKEYIVTTIGHEGKRLFYDREHPTCDYAYFKDIHGDEVVENWYALVKPEVYKQRLIREIDKKKTRDEVYADSQELLFKVFGIKYEGTVREEFKEKDAEVPMKEKTLLEKVKSRKAFLERQIDRIEPRINSYKNREEYLSKHGFREWGTEEGRVIAKEMEISFLEELIVEEEGKHGSSEGTV